MTSPSPKPPRIYELKNAAMDVVGYNDELSMNIQLKFTLKNGNEKFFSKFLGMY